MFGIDVSIIVWVLAIFLFAGVIKGVLGFGLPIITMSLLPFIMPIEKAIVISAFVQPATNVFQLISAGGVGKSLRLVWPVLLMLVPGVAIGAWYLTSLDSKSLLLLVGLTIVTFALVNLMGFRIDIPARHKVLIGGAFGFTAGVFGAMTALNGWAFIMYLVGIGADRPTFRSAIALLFLVSGALISSSFWAIGWLTWEAALLGAIALLGAFPGMSLGNRLGERLPGESFRKGVLIALVLIGCVLAVQSG
ncbi:MAG: sulfite exporter TauE/SafE family protein [Pseudomonadota bacterium]